MRYLPKDTRTPSELWADVPWYEKVGGIILLIVIPVLPIPLGILQYLGIIR